MAIERETAIELSTIIMWLVSGGVTILLGILGYSIKKAIDNMTNIVDKLRDSVDKLQEFATRQDEKNKTFDSFEENFQAALNRVNHAITEKIKDVKTSLTEKIKDIEISLTEKIDNGRKSIDEIWSEIDRINSISNESVTKLRELERIHEYCKNSRKTE